MKTKCIFCQNEVDSQFCYRTNGGAVMCDRCFEIGREVYEATLESLREVNNV